MLEMILNAYSKIRLVAKTQTLAMRMAVPRMAKLSFATMLTHSS